MTDDGLMYQPCCPVRLVNHAMLQSAMQLPEPCQREDVRIEAPSDGTGDVNLAAKEVLRMLLVSVFATGFILLIVGCAFVVSWDAIIGNPVFVLVTLVFVTALVMTVGMMAGDHR